MSNVGKSIVVIGGGTGSFNVLTGLREHTANLTALVNMSDDGGSSGILRDELGVLPPGDVRQCLVALSSSPKLRQLFNYRFDEGGLKGHSFGNLFLSAVEKMTDSFEEAVKVAAEVLRIEGRVLPITTDKSRLVLVDENGNKTKGEFKIGHMDFAGTKKPLMTLEPKSEITPSAKQAIHSAGLIVIAPGNLYGSLAPALIVSGVSQALKQTKAKIVYICNLVTKPNQTDGFKVHDYVDEIERLAGGKIIDHVIYNTDPPTDAMKRKYTHDGEFMVEFDLDKLSQMHYQAIGVPLIDTKPIKQVKSDSISQSRSLIRHSPEVLAREIIKLLNEN